MAKPFLLLMRKDVVSCVVKCLDKRFGGGRIRMCANEFWEETRIRSW